MQSKPDRKTPRRFTPQFKAEVLAECAKPDASIAVVDMAHGLNANLVHKWRWMYGHTGKRHAPAHLPVCFPTTNTAFVPLRVAQETGQVPPFVHSNAPPHASAIDVQLASGDTKFRLRGEASQCAALLRELLR